MEESIELKTLFQKQSDLDGQIALNHGVTYEETKDKRLLALLVEIGEFANETRCFKFWSFKKPSAKAIIQDEYADGLHFFLSLGLILGISSYSYYINRIEDNFDLTNSLLALYVKISKLKDEFTEDNYKEALNYFLSIFFNMGYSKEELFDCYLKKLEVNHNRQDNNY